MSKYALNANGKEAIDVITLNRIPVQYAVKIGRHVFDERSLRNFFEKTNNPRNPYNRTAFPNAIIKRFRPQIERRTANTMNERQMVDERRRLMMAWASNGGPRLRRR